MRDRDTLTRVLAVERIIQRHREGITTNQIISRLDTEYGIAADRKTIYNIIAVLTRFYPIYTERREGLFFYVCREEK